MKFGRLDYSLRSAGAASTIDTLTLLPSGGRSWSIPWAVPTSGDRRRVGSSAPQSPGEGVWAGNSAWKSPGQRAAVVNSTLQSSVVGVAIVSCTLQSPVAGVAIVSCTLQSPVVGVAIDDCSLQSSIIGATIVSCRLQSSIVGASTVNCRAQLPTPTRRPGDKAPLFTSVCPKTAKTGRLLTPAAANQGVLAGHGGTSGTARPAPALGSPLFSVEWNGLGTVFWMALEEPGKLAGGRPQAPPPGMASPSESAPAGRRKAREHPIPASFQDANLARTGTGGGDRRAVLPPANFRSPSGTFPRTFPNGRIHSTEYSGEPPSFS
jgi:hypothetical protein